MAPPRLANWLLRIVLGPDDFETIAGDFEEAFHIDIVPQLGGRRARLWYWRQVASVIGDRMASHVSARLGAVRDDERYGSRRRVGMAATRQDLSYALRVLRKHPGFTAVTVLTLALGIGANVAIFSLVDAVVFKPLPFSDPDRLVAVHLLRPDREHPGVLGKIIWSYPKYDVFRAHQRVFDSTALYGLDEWNVTGSNAPERVLGEAVEATYLDTLGIDPQIGRGFSQEETRSPGSAPLVMLAHGLWQRRFGGDPSVLGHTMGLNGTAHTIVGVLPAGFRGLSGQTDVWVPVMTRDAGELGEAWNHSYYVVARRRQGVTPEQAEAATRLLGAQVNAQIQPPSRDPGVRQAAWSATAVPLNDERVDPLVRRSGLLMLAVVGSVLLIVCVNIANLMLVRALARQQEVAIRLALGASRLRVVRLFMTESLLLAIAGGLAGLATAYGAIVAGAALLPDLGLVLAGQTNGLMLVGLTNLGFDWRTMLFTVAIVAATPTLFGLGPAWRASRRDLTMTMKAGGSGAVPEGGRRRAVGPLLIVGEVALALVLLSAGGLMLKSVARLHATELGFNPDALLTIRLPMPPGQYDSPRARQLVTQLLDRLKANGQLEAVAYGSCAPISGWCNGTTVRFPGRPQPPNTPSPLVGVLWTSPEYFETLGIRLVKGRVFNEHDRTDRPKVVVINEAAARAFWPNGDPIGQRISVGQGGFGDGAEVIGVVADVRYEAVETSVGPDVYLPLLQSAKRGGVIFVRGRTLPEQLVPAIRQEIHALDPDLPLVDVKMMDARFGDATWRTRMSAWLLGTFSALALVLAAVGIYGVVSQSVAQRSRELGVRVALGASGEDILRLVLGRAFAFALSGVVVGLALAFPAMQLLTSLLYQVRPGDPAVLFTLALTLLAVAVFASYLPARRATRVDPLTALKAE